MSKPKHRRCGAPGCGVVTARYVRTQNQGPFRFVVWARDPKNGEVTSANGTVVRCLKHADA